ncbi:SWF/SNF family helicase [Desulfosarcina ovata subsp. ovata]|uniref:SWF/SNF family helicase n=2 Tax=Desulfosarcina ovata TaxID=83564 RepID=A0A5K8AAE2_9BACT|nr:SWF/SNF family helicase [Desulfosarcina ovata subsp. ovata]
MEKYHALPFLEKKILQILSIAYGRLNQTQLRACLVALDIKTKDGKRFDSGTRNSMSKLLRGSLDVLLETDILHGKSRSVLVINRDYIEVLTRHLVAEKTFTALAETLQHTLNLTEEGLAQVPSLSMDQVTAGMRILFYREKVDQATALYEKFKNRVVLDKEPLPIVWERICCRPFDPDWFRLLPPDIHTSFLEEPYLNKIARWKRNDSYADYLESLVMEGSEKCESDLEAAVLEKWMLTGQQKRLDAWLKKYGEKSEHLENSMCLQGWMAFCNGANAKSITLYEKALDLLKKRTKGKKKVFFSQFMGFFYILALIKEGSDETFSRARACLAMRMDREYGFEKIGDLLGELLDYLQGNSRGADSILRHSVWISSWHHSSDLTPDFFTLFAYYWVDREEAKRKLEDIKQLHKLAKDNQYVWFAGELETLIQRLSKSGSKTGKSKHPSCLVELTSESNVWEHTLNALLALNKKTSPGKQRAKKQESDYDQRMAWFLDYVDNGECGISPREQKRNAKGVWTKGRPIALKRLCDEIRKFPYLTEQDKKICGHIYANSYRDGWYTKVEYVFDDAYLPDVVGHPLLFSSDGTTRLELVHGKPELTISTQGKGQFALVLSPRPRRHFKADHVVVQETSTRIKLVSLDAKYQAIADILGQEATFPASAKDKIVQVMDALAGDITIHSDIEGGSGSERVSEVEADSTLHIQLSPLGEGLKLSMVVRPLGEEGPSYPPGSKGKNVLARVNGVQMKTTRDLDAENALAARLLSGTPTLAAAEENQGEWHFPDVADSLELIQELGVQVEKEGVMLEWPEGKPFELVGNISFDNCRLNIKGGEDWFAMTGQVVVDERLTLEMGMLLEYLEKSNSRFLEIKPGQFVELTEVFRNRLQALDRYSFRDGNGVKFHPLAALALEGFFQEVGSVSSNKEWKAHIAKLQTQTDPLLAAPSTLNAELRDYQLEGINWMNCLSDWGVGACLADDMGIGKTMQTLAMLIKYAPKGPSLVIAPTSVCANWVAEANRFAPSLNLILFGGSKRKKILEDAGNFDVLICSYGLMQQKKVAAMMSAISWQMVVLDEAQAIKNFATQRSRSVMKLTAAFKVVLTGTPIENHLGELWNLFQFINPGLLGSLGQFYETFAVPIEKKGDARARKDLKRLIQPFILRRTKAQVLEELPSRTEIVLDIDLSKEETAFYEALRQQALERLSNDDESHGGQRHLKILAEITKLRQACCHSELVNKEISIASSKLAVFSEILGELITSGHKALVFSQFVGHLALVRNHLDESNIKYQYLDGSTPATQRQKAIHGFQSGEGDVFLISLKAGGVGLTLTAADYVIHMDPWWNPAVEDQASDRAHRIGQQRPVTIYRLITKGTVEEKIVQMHRRKRKLADSLLTGSDLSGKISAEELLALIQE